jgi:hypothetical protein
MIHARAAGTFACSPKPHPALHRPHLSYIPLNQHTQARAAAKRLSPMTIIPLAG